MRKIPRQRGTRPGRHHVGIPGDIISECPGDFVGIHQPPCCALAPVGPPYRQRGPLPSTGRPDHSELQTATLSGCKSGLCASRDHAGFQLGHCCHLLKQEFASLISRRPSKSYRRPAVNHCGPLQRAWRSVAFLCCSRWEVVGDAGVLSHHCRSMSTGRPILAGLPPAAQARTRPVNSQPHCNLYRSNVHLDSLGPTSSPKCQSKSIAPPRHVLTSSAPAGRSNPQRARGTAGSLRHRRRTSYPAISCLGAFRPPAAERVVRSSLAAAENLHNSDHRPLRT
jgi:hypothetical protein